MLSLFKRCGRVKVYKDMQIKINGKEYLVCYKTKLGFVSEIRVSEITNKRQLDSIKTYACSTQKVQVELIKVSTFKDWLRYYLFKMRYKLRKYKWY